MAIRYQFIVADIVPDDLMVHLPEMCRSTYPAGGTSVFGPVLDEADVWSVRARLLDLGLRVVSVRPLPD